jgi:transcriptional regulator with XRE-family HTH domain
MSTLAANVQRLMARAGVTRNELAIRAELDDRTLNQVLNGKSRRPHARTLHKLAAGLDASVDEFFRPCLSADRFEFNRLTNPLVDDVLAEDPRACADWSDAEFAELYSHFGTGGGLTADGTRQVIAAINRKRDLQFKVAVVMETHLADVLGELIELLYRKVDLSGQSDRNGEEGPSPAKLRA